MKKNNIILTESQFKKLLSHYVNEEININELSYDEFQNSEGLNPLRESLNKNKMVSVVFLKKDGTVRPMLIRKLSTYQYSDREKTEKQANVQQNNDILHVNDMNVYKKALIDNGGDKTLASKVSYRSINLNTVLGFMAGGRFFDLREENNIRELFGEEAYNSLTKTMIKKLADADNIVQNIQNEDPEMAEVREEINKSNRL
jgi:hypothetical protein